MSADRGRILYDQAAQESAAVVIRRYSTSFGWAARLLAPAVRRHVRNIYALVRVADEVVDGPFPAEHRAGALDTLEREVRAALADGCSTNLVVHAFALTARQSGIDLTLVEPFFASMRADLDTAAHTAQSFETYVYGSAEVVGLMCLRVFLLDVAPGRRERAWERLSPGARRLGAAFQKVNFLRDLAADYDDLGRSYFPGVAVEDLTDAHRDALLDDIDADLHAAAVVIPALPRSSRRAVRAAHDLFAELSRVLRETPAQELRNRRVRVSGPRKFKVLASGLLATGARDGAR